MRGRLALTTKLSAEAVLKARRQTGKAEYEQVRVVPEAERAAFLANAGETLVPPAREFLVRVGLPNRRSRFESLTLDAAGNK